MNRTRRAPSPHAAEWDPPTQPRLKIFEFKRQKHSELLNEPLFLSVLWSEHTATSSQAAKRGTDREGGEAGRVAGKRRGGRARGAPGHGELRAGREVRACITRSHGHHLIWEAGLLHPSCKGEAEQDCAVFPTGAPRAGPGSGRGADPDPMGSGRGGSPPGPPTSPAGTKPTRGCPKHVPGSPERWVAPVARQAGATAGCVRCSEPPNKSQYALRREAAQSPGSGKGPAGSGGLCPSPLRDGSLSGHGRDAPRRPPLSRTHHGIFFQLHFFHISPQISRCPPPSAAPPASAAICLISLP